MKSSILQDIICAKQNKKKLLAVLLDPDKLDFLEIQNTVEKINNSHADYIFIGGSTVAAGLTEECVLQIKMHTKIPIVIFPGDHSQITKKADALLFLSLVSGRNPEYLIEQQIKSVPYLIKNPMEIIPTGYLLIDGGTHTSTQKVSNTEPIAQTEIELIADTSLAAEYQGKQLIYLEAGSGAKTPVKKEIIQSVSKNCNIPIIVGGGLRDKKSIATAFESGADLVVIGTAFEKNSNILRTL